MKSPVRSDTIPNPTPLLFLLACTIAWLVFLKEDPDSTGLMVVMGFISAVVVPVCVYILAVRPVVVIIALVASAAMPRYFVEIGGLKARPEHIICGILFLALPYWFRRSKNQVTWMTADYLLLAYVAMHFFSSTFISISPGQTIKWCLQQAIVVLPYLYLRLIVKDRTTFQKAFHAVLIAGAAEAVFAVVCFYMNLLFDTEIGMEIGQYGSIPGTYGTQYEANLLGSFCGAASIMCLTLYLRRRERSYLYGFTLAFAGLAISLSRGALLATMIAASVMVFRGIQLKLFNKKVIAKLALMLLLVGITTAPAIFGLWAERFSTVDVSDITADDDTRVRVLTVGLAFDGMLEHPLAGNGTASYQLQFSGTDAGGGEGIGWIGNTELRILYDTGLVGLFFFGAFVIRLLRMLKKQMKQEAIPELEALAIAALLYCVSFQFTEGSMLAFCWVHLGLLAAGLAVFQRSEKPGMLPIGATIPEFS